MPQSKSTELCSHKVNLPESCEAQRLLCHKLNPLSFVARRPLRHRVNLPSCVARDRRPLLNKVKSGGVTYLSPAILLFSHELVVA